ncbi:MAG: hypothetical protein LBQ79_14060 [Deltaproteobacteria bacterium]|jgi:hypothetical protein|nr:hypothetical protein [Deltaproteobacteria bacterium]
MEILTGSEAAWKALRDRKRRRSGARREKSPAEAAKRGKSEKAEKDETRSLKRRAGAKGEIRSKDET